MQLGIPTQDNIEIYSSISQSIAVPTDANIVTLRWWQWSGSEESSTASPDKTDDRQEVMILTPAGNPIEVLRRVRQNESSWQEVAIELNATSYRGRTILLYFNVYNDGANGRTWMYIDDVQLKNCSTTGSPTTAATTTTAYAKCADNPDPAAAPNIPIRIVDILKSAMPEVVVLENVTDNSVDVTNFHMCSIRGDQEHVGIKGVIPPNTTASFTYSGSGSIWNNNEQDDGALYSATGDLISYWVDPT